MNTVRQEVALAYAQELMNHDECERFALDYKSEICSVFCFLRKLANSTCSELDKESPGFVTHFEQFAI